MTLHSLRVAVFGLGEAGSAIAADLARSGANVSGFDPADVADVPGVTRCGLPGAAVRQATLVIAATAAADAAAAFDQAIGEYAPGTLYADFSSAAPGQKQMLSDRAANEGIAYVDVALMATVPGKGLFTPCLASGPGANNLIATLTPSGASIEWAGAEAGMAATRKLLRSIVVKGLAGLVIESMNAANAAGLGELNWANIVGHLSEIDEDVVRRMVGGTETHARRRHDEMIATVTMLEDLGVEPLLTRGTAEQLRRIQSDGVPTLP
jgi:3-hydroxyisobutyrate dehydrogenase-like beta-hydroxyacid dehydrogenase